MAVVLLLWPAGAGVRIGSAEAARLAALGVTSASLLRDAASVAVVLDGWSFSPAGSAQAAAAVLGDPSMCRVLQPVLDVAVSDAGIGGGSDEEALARAGGGTGGGRAADG